MNDETTKLPAWVRRAMNAEKSGEEVALCAQAAQRNGDLLVAIIDIHFSEVSEVESAPLQHADELVAEFRLRLSDHGGKECGFVLRTFQF